MRVGFQGEPGAYSEEALLDIFPSAQPVGYLWFDELFETLTSGEVERIVLPVENTIGGIVQEASDLLWTTPGIRVVAEHVHPVRHCLLGRAGEAVTRALSHPQALLQCRAYLARHGIQAESYTDTAGAARRVAESHAPGLAAIASRAAAQRYGLDVLDENIQDDRSNRTRFYVVEAALPERPVVPVPGSRLKSSLAFVVKHVPGSLAVALVVLASKGVNLTRADSRPLFDRPFEYRFYVDFEAPDAAVTNSALEDLEAHAAEVRLFGSFPIAQPFPHDAPA